jgi:hypothetical protein
LIDSLTQRSLHDPGRRARPRQQRPPGETGKKGLGQANDRQPQGAEADGGEGARDVSRPLVKGQGGEKSKPQQQGHSGGGFHRFGLT